MSVFAIDLPARKVDRRSQTMMVEPHKTPTKATKGKKNVTAKPTTSSKLAKIKKAGKSLGGHSPMGISSNTGSSVLSLATKKIGRRRESVI